MNGKVNRERLMFRRVSPSAGSTRDVNTAALTSQEQRVLSVYVCGAELSLFYPDDVFPTWHLILLPCTVCFLKTAARAFRFVEYFLNMIKKE